MDDAAIISAHRAGQRRFYETFADTATTRVHRGAGGVLAIVTPTPSGDSYFNGVIYEDGAALVAALPGLDAMYAEAEVPSWTVGVHDGDDASAAACAAAGHRLAGTRAIMGATLDELDLAPRGERELDADPSWSTIGRLNALAYGAPAGAVDERLAGLRDAAYVRVAALIDGAPRACAVGLMHDDSCYVVFVATDPMARRQGLALDCTTAVLRAAQDAGARTTTLESTPLGEPVYARMGYHSAGHAQLWERVIPAEVRRQGAG